MRWHRQPATNRYGKVVTERVFKRQLDMLQVGIAATLIVNRAPVK